MPTQLTLTGIALRELATFNNFIAGNNQGAVALLQQFVAGHAADSFLYLYGSLGCGRSHLLQACCHACDSQGKASFYLPLTEPEQYNPALLEGLEQFDLIAIDDIQQVASQPAWEEALFHLYNRLQVSQRHLIVAADNVPQHAAWQMPDLKSRLSIATSLAIEPLSEQDKQLALCERAKARGFDLPEAVANFLIRRCPRDTASLFEVLEVLDQASLTAKRKLTVPFVKSVLQLD